MAFRMGPLKAMRFPLSIISLLVSALNRPITIPISDNIKPLTDKWNATDQVYSTVF